MSARHFFFAAFLALVAVGSAAPEGGLTNVAGAACGTRVTADTEFSEKHSAANAVDGRLVEGDGCWYSRDWTKLPCAITFELAQEEDVRRVVLHQARWHGNMYHTRDFAVETSPDGKAWSRAATGQLADSNEAQTAIDLRARTRWLRVVVLTSYNPQQTCGFTEVQILAAGRLGFGTPEVRLNGRPAPPPTDAVCGLTFVAGSDGPQAALYERPGALLASVRAGEDVAVSVPLSADGPCSARAEVRLAEGQAAEVELALGTSTARARLAPGEEPAVLEVRSTGGASPLALRTRGAGGEAAVRWSALAVSTPERRSPVVLRLDAPPLGSGAPPAAPALRPALERALIEWDWMLQDGIGTERGARTYPEAVAQLVERGDCLIADLRAAGQGERLGTLFGRWKAVRGEWESGGMAALAAAGAGGTVGRPAPSGVAGSAPSRPLALSPTLPHPQTPTLPWHALYLRLHWARREIALANPLVQTGPVLFVKQVPGCFSHQLTQYYGRYARPGGGVFVLERPGASMACRQLAPGALPMGSFMHPEVSFDGRRILFAFCEAGSAPRNTIQGEPGRYYHVYGMAADGSGLRRLTEGAFNDFSPRFLPDGRILFISTRRQGWHRCGSPGCENYTLSVMGADGSDPHPISFHETQEWDPVVANDGRILYTRWDYVDRHPVFYEHLWSVLPDGTRPAAFFGNTTFDPIGIWEARPVPNSGRIMATAAAHHAMTAGSIILVDVSGEVDGLRAITRLTPDAPFPESEAPVGKWFNQRPGVEPYSTPEAERWPGHCYRTPYPLSEKYFLAAYSFLPLVGEPNANPRNMFGLYLCDAFGGKELLYRDPNIASLWPVPLRAHPRPPALPSSLEPALGDEGVFVLQDVYASLPEIPRGSIKALRVVQVLPKSTPGIDSPPVGRPRGAPGKQVLGTVPVEADGSASFRVPARVEVAFQALDERGMAVQVMRSGTYLQPGERVSCVGCHESRRMAPPAQRPLALSRPPSRIAPGPPGSRPLSYPLLVQPVLDRRCVSCHSGAKPAGGVALTGEPEGRYTVSYNALSARVPYSDLDNTEALSRPSRYGARGSKAMAILLAGHYDVRLEAGEMERLATWMDAGALFYGTFDPADQARQQRGEVIAGPGLE